MRRIRSLGSPLSAADYKSMARRTLATVSGIRMGIERGCSRQGFNRKHQMFLLSVAGHYRQQAAAMTPRVQQLSFLRN